MFDDGYIIFLLVGIDLLMYRGGLVGCIDMIRDFNLELFKVFYLFEFWEMDFVIVYGWLEDGIGYMYFNNFVDGECVFEKEMELVLEYF